MKFYLKVINPIIAALVVLICFWAATFNEDEFTLSGIVLGYLGSYFFAKGLFAGSSIFLLGNILQTILSAKDNSDYKTCSVKEYLYLVSLFVFSIGLLVSILIFKDIGEDKEKVIIKEVINPTGVILEDTTRITESDQLCFSGKAVNNSGKVLYKTKIIGKVFSAGKFLDSIEVDLGRLKDEKHFILESSRYRNERIVNKVNCVYSVVGEE